MGFGDVTLMAVVGAAVGPARALLVVFVGAAFGAVAFLAVVYPVARLRRARSAPQLTRARRRAVELPHVPFGVFLAPAALVTLALGQTTLIAWYVSRMHATPRDERPD